LKVIDNTTGMTGTVNNITMNLWSTAASAPLSPNVITFPIPADTSLNGGPVALTATASSSLPSTYTSYTNSICTVSGSSVTLLAIGQCSIWATQAGNATFAEATPATRTFNVLPSTQTINFPTPPDTALSAAPVALTATATSSLAVSYTSNTASICTITGSNAVLASAGLCSITANQVGNANFAPAPAVTKPFNVTANSNVITFPQPADTPLNGGPVALTATASSSLPVGYSSNTTSICTVSGSNVALLAMGQCSITANQPGNGTFGLATPVTRTFNVLQSTQTITFPTPPDTALSAGPVALTATASSGLGVSYTSNSTSICTISGSSAVLVSAGQCSITANQAGNTTFAAATAVTKTFNVSVNSNVITFPQPADTPLNGGPVAMTATASSGLAVSYTSNTTAICTVAGSNVALVAIGQCSITANQAGNGTFGSATPMTKVFNVLKSTQTITFPTPPDTALADGAVALTAVASSGLAVNYTSSTTSICTISGSNAVLVSAGQCSITANQAGNGTFGAATAVTRAFNVLKGAPVIAWANPADIIAGGALGSGQLNATASVPGTFVYMPPMGTVLPVGAGQPLSVTFTPTDAANYSTASKSVVINVTALAAAAANLVSTSVLTRDPVTQEIIVTITVANAGGTTASAVQLNGVNIGATLTTTSLPIALGTIAPNGQAATAVRLPASAGSPGARAVIGISGVFAGGGSFGGNIRVSLP
jgi:hypothetical protein